MTGCGQLNNLHSLQTQAQANTDGRVEGTELTSDGELRAPPDFWWFLEGLASGVEDVSLGFGFRTLGWDLLAIPEETDSGGIAGSHDDFARGTHRGVGRCDESFLADGLTVGGDRDPGILGCTDDQR